MYKNALKEDLIRVVEELDGIVENSPLVSMEIPLRTAYGHYGWPLWHAAKSNAVFARRRIEMKQKLLDIRAEAAKENARGARAGVTF
ncbi:hypothetical protein TNCV_4280371 [Trichonephila clavipes]|nr:hypothetical protein TNCV_4280371 [Trichonephila clavipes]